MVGTSVSNATTGAWSVTTLDTSEHFALVHDGTPHLAETYWANVSLLCHCEGTSGSTTLVDETGKLFAAVGGAQLSTAEHKAGSSSILLDGNGDWFQTNSSLSGFVFGTGDFTIEASVKTSDANTVLLDFYLGGQSGWQVFITSSGYLQWYTNAVIKTGSIVVNNNVWRDIAIVRSSGNLYFFVDGVMDGAPTTHTQDLSYQATVFAIGAQVGSRVSTYDYSGYIDEVRITKGVGRYTANYTPSSTRFIGNSYVDGGAENAIIYDRLVPV